MRGAATIWGSQMAADAMEEQARIAEIQAQIAMEQALFAAQMQKKAGREKATYRRKESRKAVGAGVANIAGAGLEVSGSPLVVIGEQIRQDEISAARVITNAHARAMSEEARGRGAATGFRADASALRTQAHVTRVAGFLDAISGGMNSYGNYQSTTGGPNQQPNAPGNSQYTWGGNTTYYE